MSTINITAGAIQDGSETVAVKKLLWAAPLSGLIAAGLNTLVYFLYTAVGFNIVLPFPSLTDPTQPTAPLMLPVVIVFSFLPALVAGGLLWALTRFTARPVTLFLILSAVALVLSFGLSLPLDMPVAFKIGLDIMHIVAAVAIVGGLIRFTRQTR